MPTKQELEKENHISLSVRCRRVAENPAEYTDAASARARELLLEWGKLQVPPHSDLKKEQEAEARRGSLHEQMAEFLAGIL